MTDDEIAILTERLTMNADSCAGIADTESFEEAGAELKADVATLLSELRSSRKDSERLDWLDDKIVDTCGRRICLSDGRGTLFYVERYGSGELRGVLDAEMSVAPHGEVR